MTDTVTAILSALLPDHTPSRVDVFIAILAALTLFTNFFGESSGEDWSWIVVGFVLTMVATGPIAKSSVGRLLSDRFREIGVGGRAFLIILFAVGYYSALSTFNIPRRPVISIANGIFLWVVVFVPIQIIYVDRFQEQDQQNA